MSDQEISFNRQKKLPLINYLSYRNHLMLLYKNIHLINLFYFFPKIFWYEIKKFFYLIFFEYKTLKIFFDLAKYSKQLLKKRKRVTQGRQVTAKEARTWFK